MRQVTKEDLYSKEVMTDLTKLTEQIQEESQKPDADKAKIAKLRMQRLYRGMEMNTFFRNNNKQPY